MNFARARLCTDESCNNVVAKGHKVSELAVLLLFFSSSKYTKSTHYLTSPFSHQVSFCVAETYSYGPNPQWSCSGPGDGGSFGCSGIQGLSPGCADLYATYTDGKDLLYSLGHPLLACWQLLTTLYIVCTFTIPRQLDGRHGCSTIRRI